MKLRTPEQLSDILDQDLAWRKKEIAAIVVFIHRNKLKPLLLSTALRAGVTLLYAHWEGFLKRSSEFYLEYVSRQNLRNDQLADNFLAIAARKPLSSAGESTKISQALVMVDFFRSKMSDIGVFPSGDSIRTKSNLSSEVLKEIATTIGIDYSLFATKSVLIDERLVYKRNNVAHGQFLDIDLTDFQELQVEISDMMETWRTEIQNACIMKRYRI